MLENKAAALNRAAQKGRDIMKKNGHKTKPAVKLPVRVSPCYTCPERGIQRRFGVCNNGAGICNKCLDYHYERGENFRKRNQK